MKDGGGPVLILDDDEDVRDALTSLIAVLTRRACVSVGSVGELMARRDEVAACGTAIIDINLGADSPSGIDAYKWLRREHFSGRIRFLTGHARNHPMVDEATRLGDATVHQKPIGATELEHLLDEGAR
jgi:FixJ family two-component response regulator